MKIKGREHGSHENNDHLLKMPSATVEQLNIAKLIAKPSDDATLRHAVEKLQELTECSEDQAVTALYDCENNLERAVDLLLDSFRSETGDEWHTTGKRSKVKPRLSNEIDLPNRRANADREKVQDSDADGVESVRGTSDAESNLSHTGVNGFDLPDSKSIIPQDSTHPRRTHRDRNIPNVDAGGFRPRSDVSSDAGQPSGDKKPRMKISKLDAWDPYAEYGSWGGGSIEVINSDASIAHGLQEENAIPAELLVDVDGEGTRHPNDITILEQPVASNNEQFSPSINEVIDAETLFVKHASSDRPPSAFVHIPNETVFFAPGILPDTPLKWQVKFGGELSVSSDKLSSRTACLSLSREDSPQLSTSRQEHVDEKKTPVRDLQAHSLVPSPSPKSSPGRSTLEQSNETHNKPNVGVPSYSNEQFKNANTIPKSVSTFSRSHGSSFNTEGTAEQTGFLDPSFKNYLLDGLPNDLNSLNVTDSISHSGKPQFSLQPPSGQSQQVTCVSYPQTQASVVTSIPHPMNKAPLSNISTHGSIHGTQHPIVSNASQSQQQQTTALPPGVPHFISQFHTPAYHMFNLPGGSNNGPTLLDIDQFQFLQHLHMRQQAATTAQSFLTSTSDAPSASKASGHSIPGSMGHVTAANQGMHPEMLASAMSHAPQMMTAGHPYPYYPGFLLMNGYPNPFVNQQQHVNQEGNQNQTASVHSNSPQSQTGNQPQSYSNLKSVNAPSVSSYEDLLELKYGDPAKQVGFKNNSNQSGYGHFQGQAVTSENAGQKMSGGQMQPHFSATAGGATHPQHFSPQFYQTPQYLQAAVAAVAAAAATAHQQANSGGTGSNQQNVVGNGTGNAAAVSGPGQMHMSGPAQAMVLGAANAGTMHARSVLPHQQ